MSSKRYGLRLCLPGAPATPHTIIDADGVRIAGEYRPDAATPVPFPGMSLPQAQALDKDERVHLELVEITNPKDA